MKKKIREALNSLGLIGQDEPAKPPPTPPLDLDQVVEDLKRIGEEQQSLNGLWPLPDWLEALAWLGERRHLADRVAEWFESPLFILRMAATRVAGGWIAEGFEAERWLPLVRAAVLDFELGIWSSVTACRTVAELRDRDSLPRLLETLAKHEVDWHGAELGRALETIVSSMPDEDLSARIARLAPEALRKADPPLRELQSSNRPQLKRLLYGIEAHLRGAVDRDLLQTFGRILNDPAEESCQAHLIEPLLEAMKSRLSRAGNRSFVLVGPPGVGKTAAIRELGRRLALADPPTLVLEATTIDVMAGTRWVGEWQTRVRDLVAAIESPRPILWYVPDIANIFSAGRSSNSRENFADYLLPFAERGDIVIVGEATPEALRSQIEAVPAARQALPVIRMNEPPPERSREILQRVRQDIEARLQAEGRPLRLDEPTMDALLNCADRFFGGIASPGRQVRLLREVAAIREQAPDAGPEIEIGRADILSVVAARTGIPAKLVDDSAPLDLETVRSFFRRRVLGQESAVEALVDRIALIKAGLLREDKPLGVFFFVGPTGVGKTELAKSLAEFLFGSPDRLIRIDMSEYMDYNAFEKLIGHSRDLSYAPTLLTRVRQQPFSVVLLDEVEKAHPNVFDLFLQLFDNGRLTDASGETSDFRQTIIIMTSNLGSRLQSSPPPGFAGDVEALSSARMQREMERFFRPEFINRIDQIVTFQAFDFDVMERLARGEIDALIHRGERFRRNMLIEIQPSAVALVLKKGFSPIYGARPLKRQVEQLLAAPLARRLVTMKGDEEALFILRAEDDSVVVDVVALEDSAPAPDAEVTVTVTDGQVGRDLSPARCRSLLDQLQTRFEALVRGADSVLEAMRASRQRHLSRTAESDFWEDNLEARRVLALARHQEQTLAETDALRRELDDLGGRLAPGGGVSEEAAPRLGRRLGAIEPRLNQLEATLLGAGPLDHHDVFLTAQTLAKPDFDEDLGGSLLRMYQGWLSLRDAGVRVLDQRWDEDGRCRSWTLHATGQTLYGWLRRETGLHRFVHEAASNSRRRSALVRLTVLPDLVRDEFKPGEIRREFREPGLKPSGERFLTSISLVHLTTLAMAQGQSDETAAQCESLLRDLLHARSEAAAGRTGSPERPSIVRQYTLSPSPLVKDSATGRRTGKLEAVFAGGIEDLLLERIRKLRNDGSAS